MRHLTVIEQVVLVALVAVFVFWIFCFVAWDLIRNR
jgi:hypothetical protein